MADPKKPDDDAIEIVLDDPLAEAAAYAAAAMKPVMDAIQESGMSASKVVEAAAANAAALASLTSHIRPIRFRTVQVGSSGPVAIPSAKAPEPVDAATPPAVATPEAAPRNIESTAERPPASTDGSSVTDPVELLKRVASKTGIKKWAKEYHIGHSALREWMRSGGKPVPGMLSGEKCAEIMNAVRAHARELGLLGPASHHPTRTHSD